MKNKLNFQKSQNLKNKKSMYRQLLNNTLSRSKLKNKNRYSPENSKWCNAICQDYKLINEFSKDKYICKECRNTLNLAETQITNKTITLEQFKENPNIVHNNIVIENTLRYCTICKTDKNISNFEKTRNQCIPCRQQITKDKVNDSINDILHDIELLKSNLFKLKNYLEKHNRTIIVKVISHYKIGRKSDEIKDVMIQNIIEHFRKEIEPMKCISGCGRTITIEKISCGECVRKIEIRNSVRKTMDMDTFRNTILPTITDTMKEQLSQEDVLIYNREQLFMIARKFQISISTSKDNKDSALDKINAKIEELKNIDRRQGTLIELRISNKNIFKLHLDIGSDVDIKVINNMFNATDLCKYGNKLLYNFKELKTTKDMMKKLKDNGFEDSEIWVANKGDTDTFPQGSWIYYQLAILLCKWISVSFEQQIRKYIHKFIDKDVVVMIGETQNIPDIENTICEFPESVDNIPDDIPITENMICEFPESVDNIPDVIDIPITENKSNIIYKPFYSSSMILSGITIISRKDDGYIDLNALCKAGNKELSEWKRNKKTDTFLQVLSTTLGIPRVELLKYNSGSNGNRHVWGYPQVAINVAQWISSEFNVKISKWIYELLLLGKVELDKEHSSEELTNELIKKIHNLEDNLEIANKTIEDKDKKIKDQDKTIERMKYKRTCHKFKQGPVIYVFESFGRHKIGKVGKIDTKEEKFGNLNERLASHRCMDPNLIIKYIIYTPQYDLLEKCILLRFENKLIDLNHEFVDDLLLEDLYDGIKCIISSCGIQATFEEQTEIDKYNEKIQ